MTHSVTGHLTELRSPNSALKARSFGWSCSGTPIRTRLLVSFLASKDANFLFGTDTPSAPTYGNLPEVNGYLEMQQLQKTGLSVEQIFRAATINNARKFTIDSQVGTIGPGKIANLVLLKKGNRWAACCQNAITRAIPPAPLSCNRPEHAPSNPEPRRNRASLES